MPRTRSEWNEKHRRAGEAAREPAAALRELFPLLPRGPVLDLACGCGGNAVYLAKHGHPLTAVDWSEAALEILEQEARTSGIGVQRLPAREMSKPEQAAGIRAVCADLTTITLPENRYSVVVCVRYLDRNVFAPIERSLQPGGMVVFETYTKAQVEREGGPANPDYLLEAGELRHCFPSLEIVFYRELRAGTAIATLLARKPPAQDLG